MFDRYIFKQGSLKNVVDNGQVTGFQLQTLIPYYRGIPLSMVHDIRVEVNGEKVDRDSILFSVDEQDWFTLKELETVTTYKWEYGEPATILVKQDGGLPKGDHVVTLAVVVRNAYIPVPFEGVRTRTVTIS